MCSIDFFIPVKSVPVVYLIDTSKGILPAVRSIPKTLRAWITKVPNVPATVVLKPLPLASHTLGSGILEASKRFGLNGLP